MRKLVQKFQLVLALCVLSVHATAAIVSATLPASRSVQVGQIAHAFATIINTGVGTANACGLALGTTLDASFAYSLTDPFTNLIDDSVGANTPVDIPAGASQSYVFSIAPGSVLAVTDVEIVFDCDNTEPAPVHTGLNTILLSASTDPVADVIALASGVGIVDVPGEARIGAFAVASVNVGVGADITVTADDGGGGLPISTLLCQTDPAAGTCINPTVASAAPVGVTIDGDATPTFAVFVVATDTVEFDPAVHRVFVRFKDAGGTTRGATSVAVRTCAVGDTDCDGSVDVASSPRGVQIPVSDGDGHPTFLSPHVDPIVISNGLVYATNTPADTVDVIDMTSWLVVMRISVGVDPVGLALRPDGGELWVANHVSDTVSVIDADASSRTYHQVIATIQSLDATLATQFDEPVGIAFASNDKAYVSLGPSNEVAIVDAQTYLVTGRLAIGAQDPRAMVVSGNRLFVVPFESNNQTQLSGCTADKIDGDTCTFDAVEHVFTNNNVLSLNYDADIIRNPLLPDRDIFVYNTETDSLIETVSTVGTLLYGIAVDSADRVFVSQADARNDENGKAGTRKDGLEEMENRAFLNRITRVDCSGVRCGAPEFFELEPVPPAHPERSAALATPFAITVSADDTVVFATAASSNKLLTINPDTGAVLDQLLIGAVPRGLALAPAADGSPATAWVLNVADNTVSVVDVSVPGDLRLTGTVTLADPSHPLVKQGRKAFNDALGSTTGTFSCESCHPDGHTDQLIWVLDTPVCDVGGCTQIPPRLTMPVRGLRDTAPYHWDGIPGDPYGGRNTASINGDMDPSCDIDDPASCTRDLVDGGLGSTMCQVGACPGNDEGLPGALDARDRDAMAEFLLAVPFPPSPMRPFNNEMTQHARDGIFEFNFINDASGRTTGAQTCGTCHRMPFLVSTNTPGTGMDAPTWRGAYDRWMVLPQGRLNIIDLMNIVGMDQSFPERAVWDLAGASPDIWEMVLQGSTGFSGSFARQVTLNSSSAARDETAGILAALEQSADEGAILLEGEGIEFVRGVAHGRAIEFAGGVYRLRDDVTATYTRSRLLALAAAGELVLTLTGRAGQHVDVDHPQPALWPVGPMEAQTRSVEIPFLSGELTLRLNARHLMSGVSIFLDGRRVDGSVRCESGPFPACAGEVVIVQFSAVPAVGGVHFLQLQNPQGLFSNDMMFFDDQTALAPRPGNLIASGGSFIPGQFGQNWNTVEIATSSIRESAGVVRVIVNASSSEPWHAQISHAVMVVAGEQYTLCYSARADSNRFMTAYMDSNMDIYTNTSGGQFRADLTNTWRDFKHTFTIEQTDLMGRVAFDMAQSSVNLQIDNIGIYEGVSCGLP